ncbi:MAG TPA: DUF2225 domain-containing protein [Bacilli bacterium]|nr:DUF2225 domain-containing protein [Bacilli bacterium]
MLIEQKLYDKKVICPLCRNNYSTKKALSRALRVVRTEADFYTAYEDVNPVYYHIHVCDKCGFAYMDKTTPKIQPSQRQHYMDDVAARWQPRDFGGVRSIFEAITACKLAIFCAQFMEEPARTVGGLCLQVAWLYRDMEEEEQEMRFLKETVHFYEYAYMSDASLDDQGKMTYLLGELNRRLGNERQAITYFTQVVNDKNADPKYVRLAREAWGLLREDRQTG